MKLNKILKLGKKIIPAPLFRAGQPIYHGLLAWLGAVRYGFPSHKMVVIGITGTKGKTTTANFVWSVLTAAGFKTGLIGTANIRIGAEEMLNHYHMTMPGRFLAQTAPPCAKSPCGQDCAGDQMVVRNRPPIHRPPFLSFIH